MAATLDTIKPGSTITVKIVTRPTNIAASKTLERLLAKDPAVKREVARHRRIRESNTTTKTRGGRDWVQRMPKQHPVEGKLGESGTITASLDVLRDLKSVSRFVEVEAA